MITDLLLRRSETFYFQAVQNGTWKEPYKEKIHALTPANAEREFMIFFRALEEWRGSGTTSPAWGP
jgi:hypothetical protein